MAQIIVRLKPGVCLVALSTENKEPCTGVALIAVSTSKWEAATGLWDSELHGAPSPLQCQAETSPSTTHSKATAGTNPSFLPKAVMEPLLLSVSLAPLSLVMGGAAQRLWVRPVCGRAASL